ncbi:MAG: hypothetical protein JNK65_09060, partial [Deltaproteobacteria bacterium]|nr:hypothetical protein [Deltaproteobacteria bacterium]
MTGNISSGRNFFASESLLERLQDESNSITLSKSQQEIDQLVSGASAQLSDWKGLASMMVGGFGYHLGKTTFVKFVGSSFMKAMAPVVGLATEVTFFEGSKALMNQGPTRLDSSVGPSFMKDWLHSFVNFGILKSFGHLAQHQNVILQHSVQSLGMVAGEHALYQMKMGAKPEGSLLDQLARAEFTNLQLGLSMSLAHHLMGGRLLGIEKGLGLNQQYSSPLNSLYDPIHWNSLSPVGVFQGEAIFSYSKKLGEKGTSHSQDRVLSAKQEKSTRGVKGLPEPLKRVYSDYPELKEAFDQTPWTHEEKIKIVEWIEISEEEAASSFEYLPDYLADFEVNEANKDQVLQHLGMVFTGAVAKESPIIGNTFMASEAVNDGGIPLESFIEGYAEMKALGWSQERWFRFINEAVDHHHIDAYPKILDPVKKIMRYQNELGQNTVDLILEKYGEGLADHVSDEVGLHEGALLELNLIARHLEGVSKILNKLSVKVDKRQTI